LSIGATSAGGFNALASNWRIAEDLARDHGRQVDRRQWRLVGPVHIAETRQKAREEVTFGFSKWRHYFEHVAALPVAPGEDGKDPIDAMIDLGIAVVGTPDDLIGQLKRLEIQSGGFGAFLQLAHNWADWDATRRSYELIARYVFPKMQGFNIARKESQDWAAANRDAFIGAAQMGVGMQIARHIQEKGSGDIAPEILAAIQAAAGGKAAD
jgi:limonene 1,2-monooxygenase